MSDKDDFDLGSSAENIHGGIPKDDTDLTGMDYPQAAEYVMSFVATLKQTQKLIAEVEKDRALWKSRVDLATNQGKPDLIAPAQKKLDEVDAKILKLRSEEQELSSKCAILVENLKKLKATGVTRTVDTDRLLADFEMIIGEKSKEDASLSKKFKEEEAASELERLKSRMQGENKEEPGE